MPKMFTKEEREKIAAHNLDLVSASTFDLSDEMLTLAQELSRIHGRVRVTNEKHGIHFYIPSPACLMEHGADELHKMHLAINVQKYFLGAGNMDSCAYCMKTSTPYRVSDLLSMPPLRERGYNVSPEVIKVARVNMEFMERDANNAWIPKSPGTVVPVYQLPESHPARLYLRHRRFDAEKLWHQFRLSYCEAERTDIYYRKLLNGFRATSQGRIIFYIDIDGVNRGWQARILDFEKDDTRYYFHPYTKKWVPVLKRCGEKWIPWDERWVGWDDCKYFIGHGCKRNDCLLGFDAAYNWNQSQGTGTTWCVMAEGPLDAGRAGIPGIAIMGKAFSPEQCKLAARFEHVLYIGDNDKYGHDAAATVEKRFSELTGQFIPTLRVAYPPTGKDLGAMEQEEADQFIYEQWQK